MAGDLSARIQELPKVATDGLSKGYESAKTFVKNANQPLGEKIDEVETVMLTARDDFEKKGFCEKWKEYNTYLLSALSVGEFSGKVTASLKLSPDDTKEAFKVWNILCFWLGVVELLATGLLTVGLVLWALIIAAADAFAGYVVAYTLYFLFLEYDNKKYKLVGFVVLLAYTASLLYLTYTSFIGLAYIGVVMNVLKSVFNGIVAYFGYKLYTESPSEKPKEML